MCKRNYFQLLFFNDNNTYAIFEDFTDGLSIRLLSSNSCFDRLGTAVVGTTAAAGVGRGGGGGGVGGGSGFSTGGVMTALV